MKIKCVLVDDELAVAPVVGLLSTVALTFVIVEFESVASEEVVNGAMTFEIVTSLSLPDVDVDDTIGATGSSADVVVVAAVGSVPISPLATTGIIKCDLI